MANPCFNCVNNCCENLEEESGINAFTEVLGYSPFPISGIPLNLYDFVKYCSITLEDDIWGVVISNNKKIIFRNNDEFVNKGWIGYDLSKETISGNLYFPCQEFNCNNKTCNIHNKIVNNSEIKEWFMNKWVSTNAKPLLCRAFPHYTLREYQKDDVWVMNMILPIPHCSVKNQGIRIVDMIRLENEMKLNANSSIPVQSYKTFIENVKVTQETLLSLLDSVIIKETSQPVIMSAFDYFAYRKEEQKKLIKQ